MSLVNLSLFIAYVVFLSVGCILGKIACNEGVAGFFVYMNEGLGTLTVWTITVIVLLFFTGFGNNSASVFSGFNLKGYLYGICWGLATVAFILLLGRKDVSVFIPLQAACYLPFVAVLSYFILKEPFSTNKIIGTIFATIAVFFLSL